MKKAQSGRSASFVSSTGGEQGFWPSYADMMSAVALILFFLMLIAYVQNLITGNNLQHTEELLSQTSDQLLSTQAQVRDAQDELSLIAVDLNAARLTLADRESEIAAQDAALALKEQEVAAQNDAMAKQQALIDEQGVYLKLAAEELLEMRNQMQTISFLRLSILKQICDSLVQVIGDESAVSIGDNGNIILAASILFDSGSYDIMENAETALTQLSSVFTTFLAESENAKYVDSIIISGHTDSQGLEESNRELSTNRANAVLTYLLDANDGQLAQYEKFFCAAGYGESRPVADNETPEGRAMNRRIEISITLRDDSVMDIIDNYLGIELPEGTEEIAAGNSAAVLADRSGV